MSHRNLKKKTLERLVSCPITRLAASLLLLGRIWQSWNLLISYIFNVEYAPLADASPTGRMAFAVTYRGGV
jgi:hypothetical protein